MWWSRSPIVGSTEIPLVLFTVLIQMAVGVMVFLLFSRLTRKEQALPGDAAAATRQIVYISLALTVAGVIASLVHLGHPVRAYRALFHHLSSWMGREAAFLGIFSLLLLLYAVLLRKGSGPKIGIEFLAAITGFLGVLSSALVYTALGSVPSWSNMFSILFFLLTFVLTGAALFGMIIAMRLKTDPGSVKGLAGSQLKSLASILMLVLAASIVITGGYMFYLGGRGTVASASMNALTGNAFFWVRIVVGLVVPFYLAATLKKLIDKGDAGRVATYASGVFILLFAGEILGRVLFFTSSVMHTVGGSGTPY